MPKSCRMAHRLCYGPGVGATVGIVFPMERVACQVDQSAVRHVLDGERVDDTPGDTIVPRDQANLEDIPVRTWLDNKSVVEVARQSLCQKSLHTTPPTWDASASSQQIYGTTTSRLNGRKVTLKTLLLNLTSIEKQTRAALERMMTSSLSFGHLKGGADDHTLEQLLSVTEWKLMQKQQSHSGGSLYVGSYTASHSHCIPF